MKVNIEVHLVCDPNARGLATYTVNIVRALLKRSKNEYSLTFYDRNRELDNRQYIDMYFGDLVSEVNINECNNLGYNDLLRVEHNPLQYACYNDYTMLESDVLHFPNIFPLPVNLRGKAVVTVHDTIPIAYPEYTDPVTTWRFVHGLKRLKCLKPTVIAVSHSTKNDLVNYCGISPDCIYVCHEAFAPEVCYPERNEDTLAEIGVSGDYVLYFGATDDTRKGIGCVVEAFSGLAARHPSLKLVVAGARNASGSVASRLLNDLAYSHIAERVVDIGTVSVQQKRALLSLAKVFLFPSLYEGFGLPVLEAMACGTPVVTTNISSLPEVGGDAALYIEPEDAEELARKVDRLLLSKSLREDCSAKGFEQAAKFSWDKAAALTEEVYAIAERGR